jgi:predicted transcriptional regulator
MASRSPTPKEHLRRWLEAQPDDSTYEELIRALAISRMVERGLADVEAGRVLSDEALARAIDSWRS